jgi:lipopolysaccharide heptosyltransferase I
MPRGRGVPLEEYDASNIALLKPSALGDIVHSLPVLSALRRRFPRARITWVVNRAYEALLQGHPDLSETLAFDRSAASKGWLATVVSHARFGSRLRQKNFDLVIDLQGLLRSGLMAKATAAPRRVGLSCSREGASWFYTDVVDVPGGLGGMHAVDRYWRVAEAFGAGDGPRRFTLPVSDSARRRAADLLRGWTRPWLTLAVGSRWPTKRWRPGHFAALARRAQSEFGGTIVFVGTADEAALAAEVRCGLPGRSLDLSGRTTLPELAAVLERCDVMVANDTGPLHVAAALGRPVVAPYTCTRARLTGPFGSDGAVETSVWCAGSELRRCSRMECMDELTPDRLWLPLAKVLRTWQSQRAESA